jgi:hypothetical protein
MTFPDFCPGCGHAIRYSDNEAGKCEKIIDEEGNWCGHICAIHQATTCDWGDCEGEPAVGFRFDDNSDGQSKDCGFGWLPVCQTAYDEEPDPARKQLWHASDQTPTL